MKDPRLAHMMDPKDLPFDGKRVFWGGFETMVEMKAVSAARGPGIDIAAIEATCVG